MSRGPKALVLELAEAERGELRRLLRRRGVGQALAQRIRVVLACAEPGATNLGVAKTLGVSRQTVATWRRRFAEHRLSGREDVTGSLAAFRTGGSFLPLREDGRLPGPVRARLQETRPAWVRVVGGFLAVPDETVAEILSAAGIRF